MRGSVLFVGLLVALLALLAPSRARAAPGWSVQPIPTWVVPVEPSDASSAATAETPNGVRYLLFDRQVRVSGVVESYARSSRLITNEAGLATSSQVQIDFDPSYETIAVHSVTVRRGAETSNRLLPDAVKVVQREPNLEAQVFDGRQSLILFVSDLRVGDIVETAFTIRAADPNAQGHYVDTFALAAPEPIGHLHARLVVSDARKVRIRIHAPDGNRAEFGAEPTTTALGTEYRWDRRDVHGSPADPLLPVWHFPFPWVQVSDFDSWGEVSAWGARLFDADAIAAPKTGPLAEWISTTQQAHPDPDELLLETIRFVQDQIRYVGIETGVSRHRPTDPTKVFERRYGDCKDKAALLVALLRAHGLQAAPVLVSTRHGHILEEVTPTHSFFDHAIVRVVTRGGKVLWVDATATLQGGGLDRLRQSTFEIALPLGARHDRIVRVPLPDVARPALLVNDRFKVGDPASNAETLLESERIYEGGIADTMRVHLRGKTTEEISKELGAAYQAQFPTIRQVGSAEQADDRVKNRFVVTLHFAIPGFWRRDEPQQRWLSEMSAGIVKTFLQRPPNDKRAAPLHIPFPLHVAQTIDLDLPFDLKLVPENKVTSSEGFELLFESSIEGRRLHYAWDLQTRVPAIDAAGVPDHVAKVDTAQPLVTRSLTYRTPMADGINWAGLVALLGSLPFVVWGVVRAYRFEPRSERSLPSSPPDPRYRNIGGWLVLLAIGMVLNPIVSLFGFLQTARVTLSLSTWRALTTPELSSYRPALALLVIAEAIVLGALAAYGLAVSTLFFKRRRTLPFHFTIWALGTAVFVLVDNILVGAVSTAVRSAGDVSSTAGGITRTFVWAGIWIAYLRGSERSRFTFVERPPRRRRPKRPRASRPDPSV
ncbi:MAG: DUF2569 family protein [Deltaproteobacteria bacterium]|nr:DUF2569 family protein [Deltaproteobacteria bacterium]